MVIVLGLSLMLGREREQKHTTVRPNGTTDRGFRNLYTVAANRVAAMNPPIDDTDPIGKFSIDPGSHADLQNPAEFSRKREADTEFQYRPHIADADTIADAVSPRLLEMEYFQINFEFRIRYGHRRILF